MKKTWMIVMIVCVVIVLAAVAVACWFFGCGVHFAGNTASFNLKDAKCYIISGGEIIDQTTMTMDGLCKHSDVPTEQKCDFAVKNYTDVVSGDVRADFGIIKVQDRWCASYTAYDNRDNDGLLSQEEEESLVIVQIDFVGNKPLAKINYGTMYDRNDVWAVCADSEEEALELFRKFREP